MRREVRRCCSWRPSEYSNSLLETPALPPAKRPLGGLSSRSECSSVKVSSYWFSDPALPLTVASALRFFLDGLVRSAFKSITISSRRVRLPIEFCPANSSRSCRSLPAPLMDFCSLQHLKIRKSTCRGSSTSRYVPPSGFGYPHDGLLLPNPRRPCFVPTALMGLHPSKLFPLERYPPAFPPRMNPLAVPLAVLHVACATSRSDEPRLPGFNPSQSPLRSCMCLARRPPDAPLGFFPSRAFPRKPWRDSSRSPLTRFPRTTAGGGCSSGVPEYRSTRASLRPCSRRQADDSGRSNPLRISAPVRS